MKHTHLRYSLMCFDKYTHQHNHHHNHDEHDYKNMNMMKTQNISIIPPNLFVPLPSQLSSPAQPQTPPELLPVTID